MAQPPKFSLENLLSRVKSQVAHKEEESKKKKLAARKERIARGGGDAPTIYEKEENWLPIRIHREYELQLCDSCKGEQGLFQGDRVEYKHRLDKSAKRWKAERGESMDPKLNLPVQVHVVPRTIPECWDCLTLGRKLQHLFRKGKPDGKVEQDAEAELRPSDEEKKTPGQIAQAFVRALAADSASKQGSGHQPRPGNEAQVSQSG